MKNKIIIALVGQLASGKGTVDKYLEEKYNATTFRFSTIIRDALERMYLPISRENMQKMSTVLRQNFGEDLLAKVMAEDVQKIDAEIVSIDGVRRFSDLTYLKTIPGFYLVRIVADSRTRYKRLQERNENKGDMKKTYEEFLSDQKNEADAEIPSVMETAELELDNNGSLEQFYNNIDNLINALNEK